MRLIDLNDDQLVEIDCIFLLRRLIEAEDTNNLKMQSLINTMFNNIREYSEAKKHMPYGPQIKVGEVKRIFSKYMSSCPTKELK